MIAEDCYWYIENKKMSAICVECYRTHQKGWFWRGKDLGYGDYDLNCSYCDKPIYQRESDAEIKED